MKSGQTWNTYGLYLGFGSRNNQGQLSHHLSQGKGCFSDTSQFIQTLLDSFPTISNQDDVYTDQVSDTHDNKQKHKHQYAHQNALQAASQVNLIWS